MEWYKKNFEAVIHLRFLFLIKNITAVTHKHRVRHRARDKESNFTIKTWKSQYMLLPLECFQYQVLYAEVFGVYTFITWHPNKILQQIFSPSSSSLAWQPLVGPSLLKKLYPFVSVEGDFLPILDPWYSYILINTILSLQFRPSNTSYSIWFSVQYLFKSSVVRTHQVACPCQSFNFDVINNIWVIKCFI